MSSRNTAIDGHAKLDSVETTHSCMFCSKKFKTSRFLDVHLISHLQNRHVCHLCKKEFSCSSSLQYHLLFHSGARPYFCKICNKAFRKNAILRLHMRVHTGRDPYFCHICGKSFAFAYTLKVHAFTHAKANLPLGKTLPRSKKSKENVPQRRVKWYTCNKCDKKFLFKLQLKVHSSNSCWSESTSLGTKGTHSGEGDIKDSHAISRPHVLTDRKEIFSHGAGSNSHSQLLPGKNTFSSTIPGKSVFRGNLRPKKKHACNVCKREFRNAYGLKRHLLRAVEKHHTCDFCKKAFRSISTMKVHLRIHTGEKPYSCDYCNKSFAFHRSYKIHEMTHAEELRSGRKIMTDGKNFCCGKCGKRFAFQCQLKHHSGNSCWGSASSQAIKCE